VQQKRQVIKAELKKNFNRPGTACGTINDLRVLTLLDRGYKTPSVVDFERLVYATVISSKLKCITKS